MQKPALYAIVITANLAWGASYVVMKLGLADLTPLQLSAWRMLPAGLMALPLLWWQLGRQRLPARAWPGLFALGMGAFVLNKFLEILGIHLSTATNAALLLSMEPLFTITLGWLVLQEKLGGRRAIAFFIGALGAYLLIARGFSLPDFSSAHVTGDLIFILGLTMEAAYSIFGKSLLSRFSPMLVTSATIVLSLVVWVPAAATDVAVNGWPAFSPTSIAALAFLSLGCTVLAYWAWFAALAKLEAGGLALTLFIQPVFGALLSVWVLGETVTPATLLGGGLVLFSLYLALVHGSVSRGFRRSVS